MTRKPHKDIEAVYPLSPLQHGILFHTLDQADAGHYIGQMAYRITGPLQVELFEQAWQQTVDRHAALRTALVWEGVEEPVQVVGRTVRIAVEQLDWRDLSAAARIEAAPTLARADRERGFELFRGPLMRVTLARVAENEHHFLWTHHHVALDGWSSALVLRDVLAIYDALSRQAPPRLNPVRPFVDYIRWLVQRDRRNDEPFWRAALKGFSTPTPLVVDRPTRADLPPGDTHRRQTVRLPPEFSAALDAFARRHQLTLHTLVQGAWAVVISRYAGSPDVLFGETVSGRSADIDGIESMVGLFINTLPVRVHVPIEASVLFWLRALQQRHVEYLKHAFTPLVSIHSWSDVPAGQPLFHSRLVFENYPVDPLLRQGSDGLGIRPAEAIRETSNYPLVLLANAGAFVTLALVYDRGRFEDTTIARMLGHVRQVLAAFIDGPNRQLSSLPLLPADERRQLIVDWNPTAPAPAGGVCLHTLFEEQATRTPDAIALRCGSHALSYEAVNGRADQLARHLKRMGVGCECVVGLRLDRSVDVVVGLLGILKAGGAYLPIEPSHPPERTAYILRDARATVVVTQQRLAGVITTCPVVCLDVDFAGDETLDGILPVSIDPKHLAYVIYTSGSTGRPKGVGVEHRQLSSYVQAIVRTLGLAPGASYATVSTFAADLGHTAIFPSLVSGGTLHIVSDDDLSDADRFGNYAAAHAIDCLKIVPSHLRALMAGSHPGWVLPRRWLVLGGEASRWEWIDELRALMPECRIFNHYGPTETTVGATTCVLDSDQHRSSTALVPIGHPLANGRVHILDMSGQPAPIGVPGEIYIGGAGVARGYIGRPDLTAARFVPDAVSGRTGERLYRTGDRGRYLDDGTIEFLGRVDQQIKVRGYRIEPGEIEAALLACHGVREAVVVAHNDAPGDTRLTAYLVAEDVATDGALRQALAQTLPEYMMPGTFVRLEALPLTPNGKIDRAALPAVSSRSQAEGFQAAATPIEEMLAGIWAEVLRIDKVGGADDFFELGGHSLMATRVVSRVRRMLKVDITVRTLLAARTLAEFAAAVQRHRRAGDRPSVPLLLPVAREGRLPLSFAQQRLWFIDRLDPGRSAYNVPIAVRLTGTLDMAALTAAIEEIVRRHAVLRTSFDAHDGEPFQIVEPAGRVACPVTDLRGIADTQAREEAAQRLADDEAREPFDLRHGPAMRLRILRLRDDEHVALLTLHHIVFDGWSRAVLFHELAVLYSAYTAGIAPLLPEPPLQYTDYAIWQRRWLQGEALDRELEYWTRQLAGAPPLALSAPSAETARHSPRGAAGGGSRRTFELAADMSDALRAFSRREGVTLFMTLLGGFKALLARYTGQDDIVVGTDVANRTRGETEHLIGLFLNQVVLRTDVSGDPSFRQVVLRVRDVALAAYAHQDLPFDRLVDALRPERQPGRNPLFDVMFIVQNSPLPDIPVAMPGLRASRFGSENDTAAFDLTLFVADRGRGALTGSIRFNTARVAQATVERLVRDYESVLRMAMADPDTRIEGIPLLPKEDHVQHTVERRRRREEKLGKLAAAKRQSVRVSAEELVSMESLESPSLPLVVRPAADGVDLAEWIGGHRDLVESHLLERGGLLLRGFGIRSVPAFERVAAALHPDLVEYGERSSPRSPLGSKIYTSTDHPASERILLHNEQSYTLHWPMKIWFCCLLPARQGGCTPIADTRRILARIDPAIVEMFERKQVMYVRNYGNGLGLSWQDAFQTSDRQVVEAHCREESIECSWRDGHRLRSAQVRPAVRVHPKTGERLWFNHALFFHLSSLTPAARDAVLGVVNEGDVPFNTFYGDGSPIEPEVLDEIRAAYDGETVSFDWQEGDVLLLDNMLACHGRESYEGPRKIAVAMGEPVASRAATDFPPAALSVTRT